MRLANPSDPHWLAWRDYARIGQPTQARGGVVIEAVPSLKQGIGRADRKKIVHQHLVSPFWNGAAPRPATQQRPRDRRGRPHCRIDDKPKAAGRSGGGTKVTSLLAPWVTPQRRVVHPAMMPLSLPGSTTRRLPWPGNGLCGASGHPLPCHPLNGPTRPKSLGPLPDPSSPAQPQRAVIIGSKE
jgi:hypothetical protein